MFLKLKSKTNFYFIQLKIFHFRQTNYFKEAILEISTSKTKYEFTEIINKWFFIIIKLLIRFIIFYNLNIKKSLNYFWSFYH